MNTVTTTQYRVEQSTDKGLIKQIMTDNRLFKASMPDEDIVALEHNVWEPDDSCKYLVFYKAEIPIAVIRLYTLANLTVDMHVHLLPEYWGDGTSRTVETYVEDWLKENTNYCKIVIQTPQCCKNVLVAATREGYELEGVLTGAIYWRNKIENIVLMSKFIKRGNESNG